MASASVGSVRRRFRDDDEELEDDEPEPAAQVGAGPNDDIDPLDAFMVGVNAAAQRERATATPPLDEEEVDPLDAFMAGVNADAQRDASAVGTGRGKRALDEDDDNDDDNVASFMEARARSKAAARGGSDDDDAADEAGGNGGPVPLLPPLDHASIAYEPFERAFYTPPAQLASEPAAATLARRAALNLTVRGFDVPAPVHSFADLGLEPALASALERVGYAQPTAVQAQVLPLALGGRDVIGIAQTGSGKTAAYLIPAIVHASTRQRQTAQAAAEERAAAAQAQAPPASSALAPEPASSALAAGAVAAPPATAPPPAGPAAGVRPFVLVLAPTRELAEQIHVEARRLSKPLGVLCAALFGGVNKWEQLKGVRAGGGAHVLVATPGRAIDVLARKGGKTRAAGVAQVACAEEEGTRAAGSAAGSAAGPAAGSAAGSAAVSAVRIGMVVVDEADRLFAMGFEQQLRSILGQLRPDRQTLLFSATFRPRLESLARDALREPVRVAVGSAGDASVTVDQVVEVLGSGADKWPWLRDRLPHFARAGLVIVFAGTRANCEQLTAAINGLGLGNGDGVGGSGSEQDDGEARPAAAAIRADCIHGDRPQPERLAVLKRFRTGALTVLVATDVAARGLDIPNVRTVVNYDCARDIDSHTHRIGRTGRAGAEGTAYTLLLAGGAGEAGPAGDGGGRGSAGRQGPSNAQAEFAVALVANLRSAGQTPPPELEQLAAAARAGRGGRGGGRGGFGGVGSGGRTAGLGSWQARGGSGGCGRGAWPADGGHGVKHSGGGFGVGRGDVESGGSGAFPANPLMAAFRRASDHQYGGGLAQAARPPPPPPARVPPPPPPGGPPTSSPAGPLPPAALPEKLVAAEHLAGEHPTVPTQKRSRWADA